MPNDFFDGLEVLGIACVLLLALFIGFCLRRAGAQRRGQEKERQALSDPRDRVASVYESLVPYFDLLDGWPSRKDASR